MGKDEVYDQAGKVAGVIGTLATIATCVIKLLKGDNSSNGQIDTKKRK